MICAICKRSHPPAPCKVWHSRGGTSHQVTTLVHNSERIDAPSLQSPRSQFPCAWHRTSSVVIYLYSSTTVERHITESHLGMCKSKCLFGGRKCKYVDLMSHRCKTLHSRCLACKMTAKSADRLRLHIQNTHSPEARAVASIISLRCGSSASGRTITEHLCWHPSFPRRNKLALQMVRARSWDTTVILSAPSDGACGDMLTT